MNTKQSIVVWISPEGHVTIDAVGYTGGSCEEATAFIESELGSVGRKQRTRDFYRKSRNTISNTISNSNQQKQQS